MKIIRGLFIFIIVLSGAFLSGAFLLPTSAHVERSVYIDAPPATIFAVLNGFRQFNRWSPWANMDPATIYHLEGPLLGVGARQAWSSDDPAVGAGSQEIIESQAPERIVMRLIFSGFDGDNRSTFTLTPQAGGTHLEWAYDSDFKGALIARYFGLLLDGMIGPDYERGLAELKSFAESLPKDDISMIHPQLVDVQRPDYSGAALRVSCAPEDPQCEVVSAPLTSFVQASGLRDNGTPWIGEEGAVLYWPVK